MIWEGARMERWSYGGREMAQVDRRGGGGFCSLVPPEIVTVVHDWPATTGLVEKIRALFKFHLSLMGIRNDALYFSSRVLGRRIMLNSLYSRHSSVDSCDVLSSRTV